MHPHEVINALITLMSLHKPGALYHAAKAPDLQDVPVMAGCIPDAMLWQEQALKTQVAQPTPTYIVASTANTAPHGSMVAHIPQT